MHVPHVGFLPVEREVQRRVVDVILKALVESDDDIDRRAGVRGRQIAGERAGRDGELLHAALDEVARGRCLRKDDQRGPGIELCRLGDDSANPGHILGVLALVGAELGQGDPDVRHGGKIRR